MIGGLQDNGGYALNNNQWQNYYGADGMDTAIDPNNSDLFYGFIQQGSGLYISDDAGASMTSSVGSPGAETGNWVTPLVANKEGEIYAGYSSLYKLCGSFQAVSPSFGTNIDFLEIDDINPDNIYVAINSSLRKSTDKGLSFTSVESFSSNITSIEVHNSNSDIVYVTTEGPNGKVYEIYRWWIEFYRYNRKFTIGNQKYNQTSGFSQSESVILRNQFRSVQI